MIDLTDIEHDRAFSRWAGIGETEVELTLETSESPQIETIQSRLEIAGYRVEERRR